MHVQREEPGRRSGTYLLLLEAIRGTRVQVGRWGELEVVPGWYAYIGSAFGPGGVVARCRHHRKPAQRPHWHIDYLRKACELREIWFSYDRLRREHQWAGLLLAGIGEGEAIAGFGVSDCGCHSHLFRFAHPPSMPRFQNALERQFPDHAPLLCWTEYA